MNKNLLDLFRLWPNMQRIRNTVQACTRLHLSTPCTLAYPQHPPLFLNQTQRANCLLMFHLPNTTTEWRCHVDVIKPLHFFYNSNLFCSRSERFPRTNPLFLRAMTNMQAVLLDTESSLLIVGFRPCVGDEREEDPLLTGQTLGKLDQKDLPICKSCT